MDRLESFGVRGIPSYTVIPPPSEYTEEEFAQRLAQSGADGVLLISIADAYTVDVQVDEPSSSTLRIQLEQTDPSLPPQTVSAAMHGRPPGDPRLKPSAIFDSATPENDLGLMLTRPRIHTELRLFDVSTGRTAWVATSLTRGGTATQSWFRDEIARQHGRQGAPRARTHRALRTLSKINLPSERRCIPPGGVARRLHTPGMRAPLAWPAGRLGIQSWQPYFDSGS